MIVQSPTDLIFDDVFLRVEEILPLLPVFLKLEGLSITGSIKMKAALHMVNMFVQSGRLKPGGRLIESSSGNLGLALSMICAARGYQFTCITDPNISPITARMIRAYGAKLIAITERDQNGGFLGTRIKLIKRMLASDPTLIWTNQYENIHNVEVHYRHTAPSILREFPQVDYLFIGAGTTGTLGGVSSYFKTHSPKTRIIAVDSIGSVTFDEPAGKRFIPGLGTSSPPPIRYLSRFDDILMISERDTVRLCRALARRGILLGGSSATVLNGVKRYSEIIPTGSTVVAISPDFGDRYVDTIYDDVWIRDTFPDVSPTPHWARFAGESEVAEYK